VNNLVEEKIFVEMSKEEAQEFQKALKKILIRPKQSKTIAM